MTDLAMVRSFNKCKFGMKMSGPKDKAFMITYPYDDTHMQIIESYVRDFIKLPIEDMPLYINEQVNFWGKRFSWKSGLARWRLKHGIQ